MLKRPILMPRNTAGRWSGRFHIVNTRTRESMESWDTRAQADYFAAASNDHEVTRGRAAEYAVEVHPPDWRRGEE